MLNPKWLVTKSCANDIHSDVRVTGMIIKGKLFADTPIYRGNARKTLFTRDGDGRNKLVSLAGEISGTAQSLMDAFIGASRDGKNIGLLNRLWNRLYAERMPEALIKSVTCELDPKCYPDDRFFDLRMGIKLDEDRWAVEANANYKMETLLRNSAFDFRMSVNDKVLAEKENEARLYFLLQELVAGRFWFGAGKSKGLGRVRLKADMGAPKQGPPPRVNPGANHLRISLRFDAQNPILVGWNWGKIDPFTPSFAAIEARMLIENMRLIPLEIRDRMEMSLGGPILNPESWKEKFSAFFPRIVAIWLRSKSAATGEVWVLSPAAIRGLGKGKHALNPKLIAALESLVDKPFESEASAADAITTAFGKKANMAGRVVKLLSREKRTQTGLNRDAWGMLVDQLGFDPALAEAAEKSVGDESALEKILAPACKQVQHSLFQQVDHLIRMLQSDVWVDSEIQARLEHLQIKRMLMEGTITESQWQDAGATPEGVSARGWQEFLSTHRRVSYRHMTHSGNLKKSMTNDQNHVDFLTAYRNRTRQVLALPEHIDFREGGMDNREVSQKYGKPYDTVFMRMLCFRPSAENPFCWEVCIPGSTLKGAFRKWTSQLLKTIWGESAKTSAMLDRLFGIQGRTGLVFFSDAYLTHPDDPNRSWSSMDGIRMDPQTGKPLDASKRDCLFAYGRNLEFQFQLDLQDIKDDDLPAISLLFHMIQDFRHGDIPIGGEKTSGFGWVQADIRQVQWMTAAGSAVHHRLFGDRPQTPSGIWQIMTLTDDAAAEAVSPTAGLTQEGGKARMDVVETREGFVSHRAFGGFCGKLCVDVSVLTPVAVRESGEPTHKAVVDGHIIHGFDFFSFSPPGAAYRSERKTYALPSQSIKGLIRHIYTIASDTRAPSTDLSRLNAVDRLFGWVGDGPNQALMGRLSFDFGVFDAPELAWFKIPYPYGRWQYSGNKWHSRAEGKANQDLVDNRWRIFPHAPLAPIVTLQDGFKPDTVQASYLRAVLPKSKARFTIRFWNLLPEELSRLIWCVALEPGLAHKLGGHRYLGMGSLAFALSPDSFCIDWTRRYAAQPDSGWKTPIDPARLMPVSQVVKHYSALKNALNAKHI